MRFTIRHLLWFTMLAAIGCWWWFPSEADGRQAEIQNYSRLQLDDFRRWLIVTITRYDSQGNLVLTGRDREVDFARRDLVFFQPRIDKVDSNGEHRPPSIRSRGHGRVVLVISKNDGLDSIISLTVEKPASVLLVARDEANMIDMAVAVGLLALAIVSLFIGRSDKKVAPPAQSA